MAIATSSWIGDYQLQEVIGRGSSSMVYRAVDTQQRVVAVKVIREELLVDAERARTLQRFAREARIGKSLRHPHIIQLFDWGEHDGIPYMIMDLIGGERFDELIGRGGPLALEAVCAIMIPVLDGLAYAHSCNIVHRDVKPANIVCREGRSNPVLTDFGIAHIGGSALTQLGDLLGTPAYLSPEQLRGDPADQRSDIFAAGIMLYEATTGRRPFDGSIAEVMRQILFDEPPPPSRSIPQLAALDDIVARALAKEPQQRFPSAAAFADALRGLRFDTGHAISVPSMPAPEETPFFVQRALECLEQAFDQLARDGLDGELATLIRDAIDHVPAADAPRAATLCGEQGFMTIAQQLYATVPLPGRDPGSVANADDWIDGTRLARLMFDFARRFPEGGAPEPVLGALTHALACDILVFASEIGERLTVDEAPDLGVLVPDLARIDRIVLALDTLYAPRERRLVYATLQLVTGQILRRAAAFINRYARDRDPLARFDVVNMLVQMEELVALTGRLLDDTPDAEHGAENAVVARNVAALTAFLEAMAQLVDVSEELLETALRREDAAAARDFVSHLKQVRLIYRFGIRLDGQAFKQQLSSLVERIHELCVRLGMALTASPDISAFRRQCLSALHELAEDLGWHELAAQLLTHLRRTILTSAAS